MSENDLSLQTKGVLILVPGIFGVLSNITLMLIILSIASAQRYCPRNVTSLYEQKPLYLKGTGTVSVSRIQYQDSMIKLFISMARDFKMGSLN